MLLIGIDGEFTRVTTFEILRFADWFPGLPPAPFEGLGTVFQYNPLLSPSLLVLGLFGEPVGVWLSFMVCAALIFLATYSLGRALEISRASSLAAAWILPLLCLPYSPWLNLYLVFNLNPIGGDTISFMMLGLALLARGYSSPLPYWPAFGIFLVVLWLFLANPIWIVLLLSGATPAALGIIASNFRCPDFRARTAVLILPSVAFVVLGGAPYLLGLYKDTAATVFANEMNIALGHSWRMFTVATAWNRGIDPIGGLWIALAMVGVVSALRKERGALRFVAASILVAMGLFVVYGTVYLLTLSWAWPYPIYFEFCLWPFYALFGAYAFPNVAVVAARKFQKFFPDMAEHFVNRAAILARSRGSAVIDRFRRIYPRVTKGFRGGLAISRCFARSVCGAVIIGITLGIFFAIGTFRFHSDLYRPPVDTKITSFLRNKVGIGPGSDFRGYVASLTGFNGPDGPPTDWFTILPETNTAFHNFGNTHRIPYLWRYHIPTIEAYSQTVEPAFYAVVSRLLDRRGDRQIRNINIVTKIDPPLMESLGVRYLITDFMVSQLGHPVTELVTPEGFAHFVFELPNPNFGTYSPTQVIVAPNATVALEQLSEPRFDFHKTVVLGTPVVQPLRPAAKSIMVFVRGGWRIRARTAGVSLILLPIQFSRCLSLTELQKRGGKVLALERANLANAALIFTGTIDINLSLRVSPFWHPYCRLRDVDDIKSFGLEKLPINIDR